MGRRAGNAALNSLATYLTGRRIPDLTSGFRAAKREVLAEFLHLIPNGFSTPDDDDAGVHQGGLQRGFVPVEARQRHGQSRKSGSRATARSSS